jgi:hypothetical protein
MGDLINLEEYRQKKNNKEQDDYLEFMDHNLYFIADTSITRADKYQLALEKQRDENHYLAKYFYPDFDW